METLGRAITYD
jgi:vacuolar protein sorting-associated protein 16